MQLIDCPSEGDLRAYLKRERGSDQTAGLETHLVGCRACRLQLLTWQAASGGAFEVVPVPPNLKERVGKVTKPRSSFFQYLIGSGNTPAFAIAALVLIAITAAGLWRFARPVTQVNTNSDILRSGSPRVSPVRPISPGQNAMVGEPAIEFRWASEVDVTRYTVEVLDEDGDIIYEAVTSTDHLTVDTSQAQLHPQRRYYWHLKAKLADGTAIEVDPIPFSIR